jgi:hypothetical protein
VSTLGWEGPRIELPRGSYQFRRLGTRDLTKLLGLWFKYGKKTTAKVGDVSAVSREELGQSLYEIALTEPDDVFVWAFGTLAPVDDAPALTKEAIDDPELVPLWFITTFIDKLLDHKDFDRFFVECLSLISKDGKLRTRLRTLSGPSKAVPDGETTKSLTTPTLV